MSTAEPTTSLSNKEFFQALLQAALALLLSGVLLAVGYAYLAPGRDSQLTNVSTDTDSQGRKFKGSEFKVIYGDAGRFSDHLEIRKLEGDRALVMRKTSLKTSDYPFLSHQISGKHPGIQILLFWRTAEDPDKLHSMKLLTPGDRKGWVNLSSHKSWRGTITEIGLDFYGDLRDQTVAIHSINSLPYAPVTLLRILYSEWTLFRVWDQTSINHLRGTKSGALLSPTLAATAWAGGALLLLLLYFTFTRKGKRIACLLATAIPWIVLDLIWQSRLNTQLAETRFLFLGKDQIERHLADSDRDLYKYAMHLKSNVLPEPGPRMFLLHAKPKGEVHNFSRLKLQHHLLPHNIYNYWETPRENYIRAGDYILILDEIEDLAYDASSGHLSWEKGKQLPATRIDQDARGSVFLVTNEPRP